MKILGKFTVEEYRKLYKLEFEELNLGAVGLDGCLKDTDMLQLVEIDDEEGGYFEVQFKVTIEGAYYPDEMPFELVQSQDVEVV